MLGATDSLLVRVAAMEGVLEEQLTSAAALRKVGWDTDDVNEPQCCNSQASHGMASVQAAIFGGCDHTPSLLDVQ